VCQSAQAQVYSMVLEPPEVKGGLVRLTRERLMASVGGCKKVTDSFPVYLVEKGHEGSESVDPNKVLGRWIFFGKDAIGDPGPSGWTYFYRECGGVQGSHEVSEISSADLFSLGYVKAK
jgi:hypothetical protein